MISFDFQDDWQVWQDTISWFGNPTGPQASPVYMCGLGTVPGPIPSVDGHRRCDPMAAPIVIHNNPQPNHSHQPHQQHQQQQQSQDPVCYGTEEFIDLDMLINYVADQHSGTNDPVPPDVYTTDKSYYNRYTYIIKYHAYVFFELNIKRFDNY